MTKTNVRQAPTITRRDFIQGLCSVGIVVGLGGLAEAVPPAPSLLRPPGGQDEKRFAALCLKCNKCVEICPTNVVAPANLEAGILQARTPILNFHLGYCTFCNKCVNACPTAALTPQDPKTYKLGVARVDKANCIAWQWGGCIACKPSCKYNALHFDSSNRPVIDAAKCNGCGQCEYICPASKFRSLKVGQSRGIIVDPLRTAEAGMPVHGGILS